MTTSFINPLDLPLTPPMDLNHNLQGIDKISPFPMQLRTRESVGLFAARRDAGIQNGIQGLIRAHHGIDLLAPIGTKVYASAAGEIIGGSNTSVLILHDFGFKFLTFYQHLQNKVIIPADNNCNIFVSSGQQIAEVGVWDNKEDHLHFEVRYPFDNSKPNLDNSLPINSTFAMYYWEVKSFQNAAAVGQIIDNAIISNFEEVVRGRNLRFIKINVEGNRRDIFLPIQTSLFEDENLVDTIKQAFLANKKVRIVWRESLFFSKIQTLHDKVAIIAEIKIYK